MAQIIEEATDVGVKHPVNPLPLDAHRQRVQRLMRAATRTAPVRESFEVDLIDLVEVRHHSLLNDFGLGLRGVPRYCIISNRKSVLGGAIC